MFRPLALHIIRRGGLLVGVAALLSVATGGLPRGPTSTASGAGQASDVLLQLGSTEIPMPTSDPFL
jgi:hypothetical protein